MVRSLLSTAFWSRKACRIFRSGGVVAFHENSRRRGRVRKGFPEAGIACPRAYGGCAERTCLPVKFGVVVEVGGKFTVHVQPDGDFTKVPSAAPRTLRGLALAMLRTNGWPRCSAGRRKGLYEVLAGFLIRLRLRAVFRMDVEDGSSLESDGATHVGA